MPVERAEAAMKHDLALNRAAAFMRMADADLGVAKSVPEAKTRRLDATTDTGSVDRLSRRFFTAFEWQHAGYKHLMAERYALVKKAEAKDCKLKVLERQNARLCRLLLHADI